MGFNIDISIIINQLMPIHVIEFKSLYKEVLAVQSAITEQLGNSDKPVQTAIDMMVMADYKGRIERLDVRVEELIDLLQLFLGNDNEINKLNDLMGRTVERCLEDIEYIEEAEKAYSFSQSDLCRRYQRKQDQFINDVRRRLIELEVVLEKI